MTMPATDVRYLEGPEVQRRFREIMDGLHREAPAEAPRSARQATTGGPALNAVDREAMARLGLPEGEYRRLLAAHLQAAAQAGVGA